MNSRSIPKRLWGAVEDRGAAARSNRMAENFLRALALLTIALMAALFSNSSAREGKVFAALVGAVVAMTIAAWVSVRLVPRLASGVEWRWLPSLVEYRLTREGWIHLAATGVVFLAAVNTSNNLLYMILSAQLALLLLAVLLAGVNFRDLGVRAQMPSSCFAKQPIQIDFSISNRKRLFATFSVEVGSTSERFPFEAFYLSAIPADAALGAAVEARLPSRGLHRLDTVRVSSRHPFGFFGRGVAFPVGAEIVVYPEILPRDAFGQSTPDLMGVEARVERGHGLDLYSIRDYLPSDNVRMLDWKAFAKTTTLKTREFAAEDSRRIRVLFDRYGIPAQRQDFERLVSYTASLVYYWMRDGAEIHFIADDWRSGAGSSDGALHSILRYLALTEMSPLAGGPPDDGSGSAFRLSLRACDDSAKGGPWNDTFRSHSTR